MEGQSAGNSSQPPAWCKMRRERREKGVKSTPAPAQPALIPGGTRAAGNSDYWGRSCRGFLQSNTMPRGLELPWGWDQPGLNPSVPARIQFLLFLIFFPVFFLFSVKFFLFSPLFFLFLLPGLTPVRKTPIKRDLRAKSCSASPPDPTAPGCWEYKSLPLPSLNPYGFLWIHP